MSNRGYFGIGIYQGKTRINYGTLYRSAYILGAAFIFIIGKRFQKQCSDTYASHRHIPTYEYKTFNDLYNNIPYDCQLIGVEMENEAEMVETFKHPSRAIYLLGAEDNGLPKEIIKKCHKIIKLQGQFSFNVAVAGSIVIYDRVAKLSLKGGENNDVKT